MQHLIFFHFYLIFQFYKIAHPQVHVLYHHQQRLGLFYQHVQHHLFLFEHKFLMLVQKPHFVVLFQRVYLYNQHQFYIRLTRTTKADMLKQNNKTKYQAQLLKFMLKKELVTHGMLVERPLYSLEVVQHTVLKDNCHTKLENLIKVKKNKAQLH